MLKDDLIRDEGLKLKRYKCPAGKDTIGVGRNLEDKGLSAEEARVIGSSYPETISFSQAMMLLDNDIEEYSELVFKNLPWSRYADQRVKDVLINMCFNLGMGGLLKFKNFLRTLREELYLEAADHLKDSRWFSQVGDRAKRIVATLESMK